VHLIPSGINSVHSGLLQTDVDSRRWKAHDNRVYSMAFTVDGSRLLTAGEDGRLVAWDYAKATNARRLPFRVDDFAVIGDEELATVGDQLRVTSLIDDQPLLNRPLKPDSPMVQYAPKSRRLFYRDESLRIRSLTRQETEGRLEYQVADNWRIDRFAVTADGKQLVTEVTSPDRMVVEVEVPGTSERIRIPCTNDVHQLAFTPDGKAVVFDQVRDLVIVSPDTGKEIHRLSGHLSTIMDFEFSPDGETLASVSSDRTVRVWDWRNKVEKWSETAHDNEASAVTYSPDGDTIATAGTDGRLRLWRWRENTRVFDYRLVDWPVDKIAFASDGKKLLVQADNGLRVYDASGDSKAGTPED
jgi:WD40 repeat protein